MAQRSPTVTFWSHKAHRYIFPTVTLNGPNKFFSPPTFQRSVHLHFPPPTSRFGSTTDKKIYPGDEPHYRSVPRVFRAFLVLYICDTTRFSSSSPSSMRCRCSKSQIIFVENSKSGIIDFQIAYKMNRITHVFILDCNVWYSLNESFSPLCRAPLKSLESLAFSSSHIFDHTIMYCLCSKYVYFFEYMTYKSRYR